MTLTDNNIEMQQVQGGSKIQAIEESRDFATLMGRLITSDTWMEVRR